MNYQFWSSVVCFYPPAQHSNKPHRTMTSGDIGTQFSMNLWTPTQKIIFTPIIRLASSRYTTLSLLIISYFELFTFSRAHYWKPLACISKDVVQARLQAYAVLGKLCHGDNLDLAYSVSILAISTHVRQIIN